MAKRRWYHFFDGTVKLEEYRLNKSCVDRIADAILHGTLHWKLTWRYKGQLVLEDLRKISVYEYRWSPVTVGTPQKGQLVTVKDTASSNCSSIPTTASGFLIQRGISLFFIHFYLFSFFFISIAGWTASQFNDSSSSWGKVFHLRKPHQRSDRRTNSIYGYWSRWAYRKEECPISRLYG